MTRPAGSQLIRSSPPETASRDRELSHELVARSRASPSVSEMLRAYVNESGDRGAARLQGSARIAARNPSPRPYSVFSFGDRIGNPLKARTPANRARPRPPSQPPIRLHDGAHPQLDITARTTLQTNRRATRMPSGWVAHYVPSLVGRTVTAPARRPACGVPSRAQAKTFSVTMWLQLLAVPREGRRWTGVRCLRLSTGGSPAQST
jgi:hypothetical protein